jgi:hypothetical protein
MTEKTGYSDEEIKERIEQLVEKKEIVLCDIVSTGAMLQQLMDERGAVLKDLKALEDEVQDAIKHSVDSDQWFELVNWERSSKWKNG